ncbi:MAG TPA: hypothetical protein VGC79_06795 [Polyangiaceae bacterium]
MLLLLEQPSLLGIRIGARGCIRKSAHREKSRPCLAASGRVRAQVRGAHRENCHLATTSRRVTVLPQSQLVTVQDQVRNDPKYFKDAAGTYCNLATRAICEKLGVSLPDGRANDIALSLRNSSDWKQVSPAEAQKLANQLSVVVVAMYNPDGPGHVATVRPTGVPGDDPRDYGKGPLISDIGRTNQVQNENWAFPKGSDVRYYVPR